MPPAAHPLLDMLSADDFVIGMPPKSSVLSMGELEVTDIDGPPLNGEKHCLHDALQDGFSELNSIVHDQKCSVRSRAESIESYTSIVTAELKDNAKSGTSRTSKRVHFPESRGVQVIETIHVFNYTEEELASTFYSSKEMRDFKRERREIARLLEQGCTAEQISIKTGNTIRGIESATHEGNRHRHDHIAHGVHSVMMEQDLQYEDCKWNPNAIAYIYCRASEESVQEAYQRALKDEQEVLKDLNQTCRDGPNFRGKKCPVSFDAISVHILQDV